MARKKRKAKTIFITFWEGDTPNAAQVFGTADRKVWQAIIQDGDGNPEVLADCPTKNAAFQTLFEHFDGCDYDILGS